ncbi:TonB-dependent receptor [Reichenbachiella versicolor]|uniref:TonB-dependent receptor n=1 Tax=Reichenbachiella versicolor TaxID=1821036 RepID=UPI000D6DE46D|nr:TonB-dependent receptor [Reichenbachiella versicolor]
MRTFFFVLIFLASSYGWSQNCNITYQGQILDQMSGLPKCYASIMILESSQGMITDSLGRFEFKNICPGQYHIKVTHVGFTPENLYVDLQENSNQTISLDRNDELLDEILVHGETVESLTKVSNVLSQEKILFEANNNLADLAAVISGVNVVKNGPGVSKPVIHGLYGNRVTILNNGIKQAGQRWGNDHAPEIDLFVADHLAVIKGVAGLEISGGSLGGVLEIHPGPIANDPHLHGDVNYIFQSNGLGHTLNSKIQKGNDIDQWRIVGTAKLIGDAKAPGYFLTNTGRRESNFAGQWNHSMSKKWKINSYYSFFHTDIGILKGSHISNTRDLKSALTVKEPFNNDDNFSYKLESPRQSVNHHLLLLESNHSLSETSQLSLKYAGQLNRRNEFDVRRGGESNTPAVSMSLNSQYLEATLAKDVNVNLSYRAGLQYNYLINKNHNGTTGRLPLIPDYNSQIPGAFLTFQRSYLKSILEFGLRYDLVTQNVRNIERNDIGNLEVYKYNNLAHNFSVAAGVSRDWNTNFTSKLNIGFAQRAPEVNELYSDGVHQGVASYEKGDPDLTAEHSVKAILSNDYTIGRKLFLQTVFYGQYFKDYIYLKPANDTTTIRGTFWKFDYDQTDALLLGADFNFSYTLSHHYKLDFGYAHLYAQDLVNNIPLVFMPSNALTGRLTYTIDDQGVLKNNSVSLGGKYVLERDIIPQVEQEELSPPPPSYVLINISASTSILINKSIINISFKVENLLNTEYRDYLDRLRYFADASGINAVLTLNYKF